MTEWHLSGQKSLRSPKFTSFQIRPDSTSFSACLHFVPFIQMNGRISPTILCEKVLYYIHCKKRELRINYVCPWPISSLEDIIF